MHIYIYNIILYYTFFQRVRWVHNEKKERKEKKNNSTLVTFQSLSFNEATPCFLNEFKELLYAFFSFPFDRFVSNVKYHVLLKRYAINSCVLFVNALLFQKKKMQSLILLRFSEFYDSSITNYSLVLFTKIITIAIFPLHFHLVLYFSPSDNSQLQ